MENNYEKGVTDLFNDIGSHRIMVLATSMADRVTARSVSVIVEDGMFYFQTDASSEKHKQMIHNPHVALCYDNVQIEGTAVDTGHPLDAANQVFARAYQTHFKSSFELYSGISLERVICVKPTLITTWNYENGKPYRVFYDFEKKVYRQEFYQGHN